MKILNLLDENKSDKIKEILDELVHKINTALQLPAWSKPNIIGDCVKDLKYYKLPIRHINKILLTKKKKIVYYIEYLSQSEPAGTYIGTYIQNVNSLFHISRWPEVEAILAESKSRIIKFLLMTISNENFRSSLRLANFLKHNIKVNWPEIDVIIKSMDIEINNSMPNNYYGYEEEPNNDEEINEDELVNTQDESKLIAAVTRKAILIRRIPNPSLAVQLAAIRNNPFVIRYIKNPTLEVQQIAIRDNAQNLQFINNPAPEIQLQAVKRGPSNIQYIKNPSEEIQMVAVKKDGNSLMYIESPSEAVQLAAIQENAESIQYIENPSEAVQLAAVNRYGDAIQYIENPTEAVQIAAIKRSGSSIKYIENPSREMQLFAIKNDPYIIRFLTNLDDDFKLIAIRKEPTVIRYINKPTDEMKIIAIKGDENAVSLIHNPSKKMYLLAVTYHPFFIKQLEPNQRTPDIIQAAFKGFERKKTSIIKKILKQIATNFERSIYRSIMSDIKIIRSTGINWPELNTIEQSLIALLASKRRRR